MDRTHLGSRSEAARSPRMGTGRFAPSPTGELHLGNLRTALLAWALARRAGLRFVIRMEDLDDRCRPEFAARQLATLRSLGVDWDGPVVYQSERLGLYEAAFQELNRRGLVYECYCTRRDLAGVVSAPHSPPGAYPGTCRELSEAQRRAGRARMAGLRRGPAYRLRTDNGRIDVVDEVQGAYRGTVDDFVIRRGDGAFSYNFVAVYDDGLQGVSQVVRGEDLLASTPRHVYLQREFGFACLFISHDLAVIDSLAHRVVVMQHGKIVEKGARAQVLLDPQEEYTKRLLAAAPVPNPVEQRERREERHRLLEALGDEVVEIDTRELDQ